MTDSKPINLGNLLLSLSDAIDLANPRIANHQQRTAYIAWEIAKEAKLPDNEIRNVFIAAILHDIGAITIDEKIRLHEFETHNMITHSLRGELLINRSEIFKEAGPIIRFHHVPWKKWAEPIDRIYVISSQIIHLADFIERSIRRNAHILNQVTGITGKVRMLSGTEFNDEIVECFLTLSKRENFWLGITSHRLYSILFQNGPLKNAEVDFSYIENISKLFRDLIDFKSPFTATHTAGVSLSSELLSRKAGLSDEDILRMKIAGNLHDLGKLSIPNSILDKQGRLSKKEYEIIRSHTYYSYDIIKSIIGLEDIAEWASFHHERLDGNGYPFHRRGDELSQGSRILAVSDIFTALAENRPYRRGMTDSSIRKILTDMADNVHIDKAIVELLLDNFREIHESVSETQKDAQNFYTTRFETITGRSHIL